MPRAFGLLWVRRELTAGLGAAAVTGLAANGRDFLSIPAL